MQAEFQWYRVVNVHTKRPGLRTKFEDISLTVHLDGAGQYYYLLHDEDMGDDGDSIIGARYPDVFQCIDAAQQHAINYFEGLYTPDQE